MGEKPRPDLAGRGSGKTVGEGADSGTVVNVFVKEGEQIAKDQPILELENEKHAQLLVVFLKQKQIEFKVVR